MQITEAVNIPSDALEALDDDKIVFFVGAGASLDSPSNLPNFYNLAKHLAKEAGVKAPNKSQALDSFVGNLPDDFNLQYQTRQFFAQSHALPNRTHKAIMQLAAAHNHKPRIVTTNYDILLEDAAKELALTEPHIYTAPALPSGKSFTGVVHIHGKYDDEDSPLILSDRDFANAYLSEPWATRFLLDMFTSYTVIFIGYSHDDTMMRYLAKSLPSGTKRFVFCPTIRDKKEEEKWTHLGITPIEYPVMNKDYSELPKALEQWYSNISANRFGRELRIRRIMDSDHMTKADSDYLSRQLHTVEGAKVFANNAKDNKKWLDWIFKIPEFRQLFQGTEPDKNKKYELELLNWFVQFFVDKPKTANTALSILNGQPMSDVLFNGMCRSVVYSTTSNPEKANKLATYLTSSVPKQSKINWPNPDAFMYAYKNSAMPLSVLSAALHPFIPSHFNSLSWQIHPDDLTKQLNLLIKNKHCNRYQLFTILEGALIEAYDLARFQTGTSSIFDYVAGLSECRIDEIETTEKPISPSIPNAIIVALRKLGQLCSTPEGLINHWLHLSCPIFIRLAVDAEHFNSNDNSDSKIRWILDNNLLFDSITKPETFSLLSDAIQDASETARTQVLKRTLEGPQNKDYLDQRSFEYEKYNLLVWLCNSTKHWENAEKERNDIAERLDFAPRSHPDLDIVTSSGIVDFANENPLSDDEFDTRAVTSTQSLVNLLISLPSHDEQPFADSGTFEGGLNQLTRLSQSNVKSSIRLLKVIDDTDMATDKRTSLTTSVIKGWEKADSSELTSINKILESHVTNPNLALPIAQFIDMRIANNADMNFQFFSALAQKLWKTQSTLYTPINPSAEPFQSTVNEWPGIIINNLIEYVISLGKHNAKFEKIFSNLLNPKLPTYGIVSASFAMHFSSLFKAYPDFIKNQILPLFSKEATKYWCWNTFLLGSSLQVNPALLKAGFVKQIPSALQNWKQLGTENDGMLHRIEILAFNALSSKPSITKMQKQSIMSAIVSYANPCHFASSTLHYYLSRTNQSSRKRMWSSWLHRYFQNRCNGLPRDNTQEEISWLAIDLFYLDTNDLNTALDEFGSNKPYLTEKMIFLLEDDDINWSDSSKLELFERMLKNSRPDTPFANYTLQELFEKLAKVLAPEKMKHLYDLAFENGFDLETTEN